MDVKIIPSGQTIVKPTALGPVANTDTKLLIYGLFQKGRVLAQDGTRAIFSQSFLARVHWELDKNSRLAMPGASVQQSIPLCRLNALGGLGYDVRDITDAFEVDRTASRWTPYPGFWDHDAERVIQIAQASNAFLIARTKPIKGRKLKSATAVWGKAGKVLLVSRLRTNTHKVLATGFDQKVLGNTWWAFDDDSLSNTQRKALLLWLTLIAKSSKHENAKQPHWAQARSSCWGTRSPPL